MGQRWVAVRLQQAVQIAAASALPPSTEPVDPRRPPLWGQGQAAAVVAERLQQLQVVVVVELHLTLGLVVVAAGARLRRPVAVVAQVMQMLAVVGEPMKTQVVEQTKVLGVVEQTKALGAVEQRLDLEAVAQTLGLLVWPVHSLEVECGSRA